jgi:hypothetical protein
MWEKSPCPIRRKIHEANLKIQKFLAALDEFSEGAANKQRHHDPDQEVDHPFHQP